MARTVAGTLLLPDGSAFANVTVYFVAKRNEGVGIVRGVTSEFATDITGAYSVSIEPGYYAISASYTAADSSVVRRAELGKAFIEDGVSVTLNALLAADESVADPTSAALLQLLADAKQARDDAAASASAAASSASAASTSETNTANSEIAAGNSATSASASATSAGNSETAASAAQVGSEAARDKSNLWAEELEDILVEPGKYSALHHSIKASLNETNSASAASAASTSQSAALASENKAQDWADTGVDIEVELGKYSGRHWSAKSEASAQAAAQSAAAAAAGMTPMGSWDASGGVLPTEPTDGSSPWYSISIGGTLPEVGAVLAGDNIYYSAATLNWHHIDNGQKFTSINGYTSGTVNLTTDDVSEGGSALYYTAARVRAVVLTGLSTATAAVISATDSVLGALGKLQAQVDTKSDQAHNHDTDYLAATHPASTVTTIDQTNWDTAYGWGDHASGGYAKLTGGASANFTAMPQVGGDPIVEGGSNADGEWTRWADGTLAAYQRDTSVLAVTDIGVGSIFYEPGITLNFPQPFFDIGKLAVAPAAHFTGSTGSVVWGYTRSPTTTGVVCGLYSHGSGGQGFRGFHVIGRWK